MRARRELGAFVLAVVATVGLAGCDKPVDLTKALQVEEVSSGWHDAGMVEGKNKLVPSAEFYEWSSYRAHAFGRRDPLLTPHRLFLAGGRTSVERQRAWQVTCGASIDEDALVTIRRAIRTGLPLKDGVAGVEQSTADGAPGA